MGECLFVFLKCQSVLLSNYHQDIAIIAILRSFLIANVWKTPMCEKNQMFTSKKLYDFKNANIENSNWQKFAYDIIQVLSAHFSKKFIIKRV